MEGREGSKTMEAITTLLTMTLYANVPLVYNGDECSGCSDETSTGPW